MIASVQLGSLGEGDTTPVRSLKVSFFDMARYGRRSTCGYHIACPGYTHDRNVTRSDYASSGISMVQS